MKKSPLKDITRPDALTTTLKVLFGVSLLVGIAKLPQKFTLKFKTEKSNHLILSNVIAFILLIIYNHLGFYFSFL